MSIGDSLSELLNEKALQLVELDGKSITQLLEYIVIIPLFHYQ